MKAFALMVALSFGSMSSVAQAPADSRQELKNLVGEIALVRKAIADGYLRWIEATKTKDVDAALTLYTDDAVMLPDDGNTAKGKDAIRAFYKQWYSGKDKLVRQQFDDTGMLMNGPDVAIETADFSGVSNVDGKDVSFRGKNLIVWKRQTDGSWKILRDIWNSSPAN